MNSSDARTVVLSPEEISAIEERANAAPHRAVLPVPDREAAPTWFAVYTNINCERRALGGIEAAGYRAYMPILRKWIKVGRSREEVERPLFPRYLFVAFAPTDAWYPIRRTNGVEYVVCACERPLPVPAWQIERIRRAEEIGKFNLTRAGSMLKPGDRVEVDGGPLGNFIAEVATPDDGRRVEILHGLFNRLTKLQVDLARVAKIEL